MLGSAPFELHLAPSALRPSPPFRLPPFPPSAHFPPMLTLTFLGTGAACPSVDRNVSSLAIAREGETMLFDCGEGTQRQMMRYGVGFSFREIFSPHYHADHMLGVTGLLRTMGLQDRTAPVTLYGPRGAARVLGAAVFLGIERSKFPVEIVGGEAGRPARRDGYVLEVFPTEHRADTIGWALVDTSGSADSIRRAQPPLACPRGRSGEKSTRVRAWPCRTAQWRARRSWSGRRGRGGGSSSRGTPGRARR